ncbi:MAG TPA: sigma-70 family RNA polymerase sigma factor [Thermoanaerobaculia bacterium]|nr:sigma-70 family RNA polymerase sigma factor [Thermoanaerobaculia bacterium]
MSTETVSEARKVFEILYSQIEQLARKVARRHHLRQEELEDFCSYVAVKMLADECAVLRKFRGASSLRTYLVVVIQRMLLDFRTEQRGKWRTSVVSKRLGPAACRLDLLMNRDGFSLDEAVETVQVTMSPAISRSELLRLAEQVPRRSRPQLQPLVNEPSIPDDGGVESCALDSELAALAKRTRTALVRSVRQLPLQDRQILRLHFSDSLSIRQVAKVLDLPARHLYSRLDRCLKRLAVWMRDEGISAADADALIGWESPRRNGG